MEKPLEELKWYLNIYHPYYTLADVKLSPVKGYLRTTKPCSCRNWLCSGGVYHTIQIEGVGYPARDKKGRFISQYKLWHELHGLLPEDEQ